MKEIVEIVFPFFSEVKNYNDMLKKLAATLFWELLGVFALLMLSPSFSIFIDGIVNNLPKDFLVNGTAFVKNIIILITSSVISIIAYSVHLHDKISDILGIRNRFDIEHILLPLLKAANIKVDNSLIENMRLKKSTRQKYMNSCFYEFASSTKDITLVDKHYIHKALNQWTWVWVAVEGCMVWFLSTFINLFLINNKAVGISFFIFIGLVLYGLFQYNNVKGTTRNEIEQIISNPEALNKIRNAFNAL